MFKNLQSIPINGIRVFEAAARLSNFAAAASELNVTPAAVSQQIKKIENRLGVQLFERTGRNIKLTEVGYRLYLGVSEALNGLDEAVGRAKDQSFSNHISISTVGAFAARWLVPRLDHWRAANPDVDIRVSTSGQFVDFDRDQIDLAIRIGDGQYPGLSSELLLADSIVPLCHPSLLDGVHPLNTPEDLVHHTLIHFRPVVGDINTDWGDWLASAGLKEVDHNRGLFFNDYSVAVNAAMTGQGVLLSPRTFIDDDLRSNMLVVPFGDSGPQKLGWYIVMPRSNLEQPNIAGFRDWLISESAVRY
jgi:LysR family transcriptional regulator, glycine cleavage system transcriptional activator